MVLLSQSCLWLAAAFATSHLVASFRLEPERPFLRPVISALTVRPPGHVHKRLFHGLSFANPTLRCFGFLVPTPYSACTPVIPPFPEHRPYIPIVPASGCPVHKKIQNLLNSNASGMIIYQDNEFAPTDLSDYKSDIESPCVIVIDKLSGEQLLSKVHENNTNIIIDVSPEDPDTAAAKRLIWLVGVMVTIITLLFLIRIVQNYIRLQINGQEPPRTPRTLKDMQRQAIDEIPVRQIPSQEENNEQCSICLEGFPPGIMVRTLKCRHEFHPNCIDEWLLRNRLCPLCKHPSYQLNLTFVSLESLLSSFGSEDGEENPPEPEEVTAD